MDLRSSGVAATVFDGQLDVERDRIGDSGDDHVAIDDFDLIVANHIARGHDTRLVTFNPQRLGGGRVILDDQRLEVQADVGDIFHDTRNRGEFVLHTVDLGTGDRTAFQARQQDATQAVRQRVTKPALERLDHELAVIGREGFTLRHHSTGQFQISPTNPHAVSPPKRGLAAFE